MKKNKPDCIQNRTKSICRSRPIKLIHTNELRPIHHPLKNPCKLIVKVCLCQILLMIIFSFFLCIHIYGLGDFYHHEVEDSQLIDEAHLNNATITPLERRVHHKFFNNMHKHDVQKEEEIISTKLRLKGALKKEINEP